MARAASTNGTTCAVASATLRRPSPTGNLGYEPDECAPLVKKLLLEEPDLDVTGALRASLKALARGKA